MNDDMDKITGGWDFEEIVQLMLDAGRLALDYREDEDLRLEMKKDSTPVTEADRDIEALFASRFDCPRDGTFLIGEETVFQKGEEYLRRAFAGHAYVVDPIDGTSPYAHHLPNWGISLGRMVEGKLTDGALYLPDYRLMLVSDGPHVHEGTRAEGSDGMVWRLLRPSPVEKGTSGIIVLANDLIKHARLDFPNPVQCLGAAVAALAGLLTGRILAYVGLIRLWDVAGSLPLLHRLNCLVTRLWEQPGNRLGTEVSRNDYFLDPNDSCRFRVRGGVLFCPPSEELWIRESVQL